MAIVASIARYARTLCSTFIFSTVASLSHAQAPMPSVSLNPIEPDDVRQNMRFGTTATIVGGTAFVGAPQVDGHGAVYIFEQQGGRWVQVQKLIAPDVAPGRFGSAIVQDSTSALIADEARQRVYYFQKLSSTRPWRATAILRGGAPNFGSALAMEGCTALISSNAGAGLPDTGSGVAPDPQQPGLVHLFNRCSSGSWTWKGSLAAPDARPGDAFGHSLALSGSEFFAGAPGYESGTGRAYHYVNSNGQWRHKTTLVAPGPDPMFPDEPMLFGNSVAFHSGLAAIGAPYRPLTESEGSVFLYRGNASGNWILSGGFLGTQLESQIGWGVKVTADRVFVSGIPRPAYLMAGTLHIYRRDTMQLERELVGNDPRSRLAIDFAVAGRSLIVGDAHFADVPASAAGAAGRATIYQLPP